MNDERRLLLAVVLSAGIFIVWYTFFAPQPSVPPKENVVTEEIARPTETANVASIGDKTSAATKKGGKPTGPEKMVEKSTGLFRAVFSNYGGTLKGVFLNDYRKTVDKESPPVDIINSERDSPLELVCDGCNFSLPRNATFQQISGTDNSLVYQWTGGGITVEKHYTVDPDRYLINLEVVIANRSGRDLSGGWGLGWSVAQVEEVKSKLSFLKMGAVDQYSLAYQLGGKVSYKRPSKKAITEEASGAVAWGGLETRYFLNSIVTRRISSDGKIRYNVSPDRLTFSILNPVGVIPAGQTVTEKYLIYSGPKESNSLKSAGVGLETAVDYGWFSILARPILKLLQIFQKVVKNWGVAIILLTIVVKLLMHPLTVKSLRQMKEMQRLQPRMKEIREKFGDDKQRLNTETMQLFKTHKVNPLGGCLPMLLQMPIYIALYKVLWNSIELYHAPFFWFYKDLSSPDPYFIMPILMGISMVAQQKLTPTTSTDPAQQKMMMLMPVMFTAFMLFLPMGLVLYIFVNTFMSVVQQYMHQHDLSAVEIFKKLKRS